MVFLEMTYSPKFVPTVDMFINKLKLNLLTNVPRPTVGTFRKRPILCNAPQKNFIRKSALFTKRAASRCPTHWSAMQVCRALQDVADRLFVRTQQWGGEQGDFKFKRKSNSGAHEGDSLSLSMVVHRVYTCRCG